MFRLWLVSLIFNRMKTIFKPGDTKIYTTIVKAEDQATFHGEVLHAVCSTFALARDIEWSSRLFFIEMKEPDEEGVGTFLEITHRSPAFVGETIIITATVKSLTGNELLCDIEVKCGDRLIAMGKTGQRMLKKDRLNAIFTPPKP
jgi:fluoroacetyl-CoA thioesterase